jgi:hypothetical protein
MHSPGSPQARKVRTIGWVNFACTMLQVGSLSQGHLFLSLAGSACLMVTPGSLRLQLACSVAIILIIRYDLQRVEFQMTSEGMVRYNVCRMSSDWPGACYYGKFALILVCSLTSMLSGQGAQIPAEISADLLMEHKTRLGPGCMHSDINQRPPSLCFLLQHMWWHRQVYSWDSCFRSCR